nr:hypothetical protein [Streptomyces tsukubensis NRRL18488]
MTQIYPVLQNFLWVIGESEQVMHRFHQLSSRIGLHFPGGRRTLCVMPHDHNAIDFTRFQQGQTCIPWRRYATPCAHTFSGRGEGEMMKRTDQVLRLHRPPVAQMRPEVGAVGFRNPK